MSVWTYQEPPWEWNGDFALNAVAGKHPREFWMDPRSYDDMLPGCHDIGDRIKDMDTEGVRAQLCFPNFGGSATSTIVAAKDRRHISLIGVADRLAVDDRRLSFPYEAGI